MDTFALAALLHFLRTQKKWSWFKIARTAVSLGVYVLVARVITGVAESI